jgi:hypothetical protein
MKNPVVASDGHTYERDWIDRHIKTAEDKRVSGMPITGNL